MNTPAAPRQAPAPAALKKQAAGAKKPAPAPPPPLTPEQQAQEQAKITAINDEWKAKLSDGEKAEVLDVAKRNGKGIVVNDTIQPCVKKKKPKVLNCVPGDPAHKSSVSQDTKDAVKKAQEDKRKAQKTTDLIDYGKVTDWEGGSFDRGYVPWGPKLEAATKDIGEPDRPHNVTMLLPNTAHNKAPGQSVASLTGMKGNNSGVTVGAGVDLGAKDGEYSKSLKASAKSSGLMTEEEAGQLADKLKPYYGLKRTEACQALRKTPLDLTKQEESLVNYESFMTHTDEAIRQYKKATEKEWGNLSEQEQTLLFSQKYHHGSMKKALATAVGDGDSAAVLRDIKGEREYSYMKAYYDQLPPKAAPTSE